ncbi:hypothetical protein GCM10011491_41650 [Brucella endophytica]|uniref:Transglycosylase SLT domain-containing protein n=2 Tax=Brucella endophytica TaxID=1963359 RepID=A0A916SQZ1_9HYPH|nr:hypothetical protein GCM10011491_41650 [Brucella endophytica]
MKKPDERIALSYSEGEKPIRAFVLGEDGVAVKASEAAPVGIVGARETTVQRPDLDSRQNSVERLTADAVEQMVIAAAKREGVDPKFAVAIAKIESRFNQFAYSEDGAIGVMQLMPGTASALGVQNPWDAVQNINGGVRYLKELTAEFRHPLLVAAAYHSGPQAVRDAQGIPKGPRTAGYMVALLNDFYDIYGSSAVAVSPVATTKNSPSENQTAAISGDDTALEETPASNSVGKWDHGFVMHLD